MHSHIFQCDFKKPEQYKQTFKGLSGIQVRHFEIKPMEQLCADKKTPPEGGVFHLN